MLIFVFGVTLIWLLFVVTFTLFSVPDACALVLAALEEASSPRDQKPVDSVERRVLVHPSYILKGQSRIPENHNDQIRLLTVSYFC